MEMHRGQGGEAGRDLSHDPLHTFIYFSPWFHFFCRFSIGRCWYIDHIHWGNKMESSGLKFPANKECERLREEMDCPEAFVMGDDMQLRHADPVQRHTGAGYAPAVCLKILFLSQAWPDFNPSTREAKAGGSEFKASPWSTE